MGLGNATLATLRNVINTLSKPKILFLGYQDLLVSDDELKKIFGDDLNINNLRVRKDSEMIITWHGAHHLSKIYDTFSLFEQLDCELSISDIEEIRGGEVIIDLNIPLKTSNQYNIIFDGGTMEHCFNIGQAIQNIIQLTKLNGYILHTNPLQMINHAFYNISPTFYWDVYNQNGHKVLDMKADTKDGISETLDPEKRIFITGEAAIHCLAQKLNNNEFIFPTQGKYLKMAAHRKRAADAEKCLELSQRYI